MDSFDHSVYKDCTPLFTGPQSRVGMRFGDNSMPILQGMDNLEKLLVYFSTPDRSMTNPHDQFEGELANKGKGQGRKVDIFPVWRPLQLDENVDWGQWQNHKGLDEPMANTIATGSYHSVVDDIPPGPSHASEGQEANLQSGSPRKLAASAQQTQDSSKRPKKRPDFVLPDGWTKKVITRENGKKDTLYIEDATQHRCRSQLEVIKYLESKASISLQEETTGINEGH